MRRATPRLSPVEWLRHRNLQSSLFIPVSISNNHCRPYPFLVYENESFRIIVTIEAGGSARYARAIWQKESPNPPCAHFPAVQFAQGIFVVAADVSLSADSRARTLTTQEPV
jgi:hypothetical protein